MALREAINTRVTTLAGILVGAAASERISRLGAVVVSVCGSDIGRDSRILVDGTKIVGSFLRVWSQVFSLVSATGWREGGASR